MKNLICILLLFTGLCAKAQVEPVAGNSKLRTIALSLDSFSTKVPVEKVHIHFDKPYYSLGDTIWMKVYVVNENNGLSPLSKILYADLVDDKGQIKISLNLPLTKGLGWGAVTLNDSLLRAGNYHIRAYTTLMRNFGQEYFFDKVLYIGNALPPSVTTPVHVQKTYSAEISKNTAKAIPDSAGISIKFFPEGGTLVNNLASKIAFKAIGTDGLSREISGYVVDKDNRQLTDFKSEHAGMGAFSLQPAPGNTYTAVVKFKDSSEKRFKLPVVADKGYALSVVQTSDNIIVNIQASKSLVNTGEISLIAQANNTVQYTGKKELIRTGYTTIIPKSRFPEGIVQFTLFSPGYQPVAERLVFVHHAEQRLKVNIVSNKPDYDKRGRVHLDMEVTDQDGKPVTGAFSLAVTDGEQVPYTEADEKTIFSNLLLTSDLKGYIEQPNYYFTDITPDKDRQLDNLLLTQGWRRFIWQDILTNTLPNLAYQAEAGMGISGRILTGGGKPAAGAKVSMLLNVGDGMVIDTVTNAQGHFNFDKLPFSKNMAFNVSAVDAKGKKKNLKIEIDKKNATRPVFDPGEELSTFDRRPEVLAMIDDTTQNSGLKTYLQSTRKRIDELTKYDMANHPIGLKEVIIKENKADKIKELALQFSKSLSGPADDLLTFVDLADCAGPLGGCMIKHPAGMHIKPNPNGSFSASYEGAGVPVIVDGNRNVSLASISPDQIAAIEFIKGARAAIYKAPTGAILITLKRGGVDYQKYIDEHDQEKQKEMAQKKEEKEHAIALKEVTIEEKRNDKIKEIAFQYSDSRAGRGGADQELTFVDLANCANLGICLAGKLTNVKINVRGNDWIPSYQAGPMAVVVDGRIRTRPEYTSISPDIIAGIEVIKGARAGNLYGGNITGAIIITTKRGGEDYNKYIEEHNEALNKAAKNKPIQLNEVEVIAKKMGANSVKDLAVKHSQNLAGPGNADQVLTFIDLLGCQHDLKKCLAGRLLTRYGFDELYLIVDGIPGRALDDVVSSDVSSVELLRGGGAAALYGVHASNGVLIVTTKKGDIDYEAFATEFRTPGYDKPKGLVTYKVQDGYDLRREFYAPDYNNPATDKQMPDLRSTIYWKPNIITDEQGKASVEFFNADGAGKYRVIAEGLDGVGKLGRQVYSYTVK